VAVGVRDKVAMPAGCVGTKVLGLPSPLAVPTPAGTCMLVA